MRTAFLLFVANLLPLALIALTFYMVAHDKEYWYWPMIIAAITSHTVESNNKKEKSN